MINFNPKDRYGFEDLVEISGESIMEIDQYLGITED